MKCQHCEKPATFHITELTDPEGPQVVHLCEEHVRAYLSQEGSKPATSALAGMLAKQLKLEQTAEQLAKLDKKTCPVCGISFAEFRQAGRLGCPYDYVFFHDDLEPLLINIHGARIHKGKRPSRSTGSPDRQHRLIQLRREMQEAIVKEQYERAGELRDTIRQLENGAPLGDNPLASPSPSGAANQTSSDPSAPQSPDSPETPPSIDKTPDD